MAILPIYTYGTPVLREKAIPVTAITDATVRLIMDMFETMRSANGIGLAANQVGHLERILTVDIGGSEEYPDARPLVVINPEIISGTEPCVMEEGCLSIPDVRDQVERPGRIVLRYKNTLFQDQEQEFDGLMARVLQHEIDHLNGVLFVDRIPDEKRSGHTGELEDIRRGDHEVEYPIVSAAEVIP